ncbi:MAG TPA: polysaccharide deacetylase family protein [Solirubrobacteraceae bacterium]
MSIGIALEAFRYRSQYVQSAPVEGREDIFSLSFGEYGCNIGIWRLMTLLDSYRIAASVSCSGELGETRPDVIAAVGAQGHDIVAHGWVNDELLTDEPSPEAEDATIRRTLSALEAASGQRPRGWGGPANARSPRTLELLAANGVDWCGDDASADLPFVHQPADGRSIVVMPKSNVVANDLVHWLLPQNPPSVLRDNFIPAFDTLCSEASEGRRGWIELMLHAHVSGRPALVPTIRSIIDYVNDHASVVWATKSQLADWTIEELR